MRIIYYKSSPFKINKYLIAKIIKTTISKDRFEYKLKFHKDYNIRKGFISNNIGKNIFTLTEDPLLKVGDIIEITQKNEIIIQLSAGSSDNSLLVNNHCNLQCINCPQENNYYIEKLDKKNFRIIDFIDKNYKQIGLTGGEPTLDIDYLIKLILAIYNKCDSIRLDILTNAINLSNYSNYSKLESVLKSKVSFCIALYSDSPEIHDNLTKVQGSFWKTVRALNIIASFNREIELRYVINKINYHRLPMFIDFVYNNFPYINRIALMAMEYSGNANTNAEQLFIKQSQYSETLTSAIKMGKQRNLQILIYNHQICKLDKRIWQYCVPSISDWKALYLSKCKYCALRDKCGGFFGTSNKKYIIEDIDPIIVNIKKK